MPEGIHQKLKNSLQDVCVKSRILNVGRMDKTKSERIEYGILAVIVLITYLAILQMLIGQYVWERNAYNTYALQADSWRQGRLEMPENYNWLELAIYDGKYYCSFPPFPSYVLFPFTFIFGSNTPDGWILLFFDIMLVVFLYKIGITCHLSPKASALSSLFFSVCTNMTFIMISPSVWFFAQVMSFSLSAMSIYFALKRKGGWSLLFWSCAVGCRPMQVFFIPVLLLLLFWGEKKQHREEKWYMIILKKIYWGLPALGIAVSYMVLNYVRFGNIAEFGHNYLPEFTRLHQQFSIDYIANNFETLMRLPDFSEEGRMIINHFGNLNFLWVNPPILFAVLGILLACIKKEKKTAVLGVITLLMAGVYLIIVMMHATMGGWHFGNRYTNDMIPWFFVCLMMFFEKHARLVKWQLPFAVWGILFNVVGTVIVYNGLK